jgi:hypothetical protein
VAYALIGHDAGAGTSGGGTSTGFNTSGANLIVLAIGSYPNGGATVTVSDTYFNMYTPLTVHGNSDVQVRLYYCASPTVGVAHQVTVSGASIYPSFQVAAFSGADASPFDQEIGQNPSVAQTIQPGSLTPSMANSLVVTGLGSENSGANTSYTADSGFTSYFTLYNGGNSEGSALAWRVSSVAQNPTWSLDISAAEIVPAMATFNPATAVVTTLSRLSLLGVG